jgi:hypothetical protein
MRTTILVTASVIAGCAGDDDATTSTTSSALTELSIPSVSPVGAPLFEKLYARNPGDPSAQLNFELELKNTGSTPVALTQVAISYELDGEPFGESPVVSATDLRSFYLDGCGRAGFGPQRTGVLTLDLPAVTAEGFSDVHVPSANVYATVRAKRSISTPDGRAEVSRFTAVKLDEGRTLGWARLVDFFNFEDRANALTPADADVSAYVAVGGAHAFLAPWRFAAVKLTPDGEIARRDDGTLWQTTVAFAGCSAEAIDVARLEIGAADNLYFLAGDANCGGDQRIALAMLDGQGNPLWSKTIDPGAQPAHVGGVTIDPDTDELYIVGRSGEHLLVINTDSAGVGDPTFGVLGNGIVILDPTAYDKVFARDAKVLDDGRLVIAAEAKELATGAFRLGMWRFLSNGTRDFGLKGTGVVWTSFPGITDARGTDIEVHENETWFTVTGIATTPGNRFVAAAFDSVGDPQPSFGRSGKLVIDTPFAPVVTRSFLRNDFITLVGGTGSNLAAVRFHRLDGSLDDPAVLSPGDRCALKWPDSGILPSGATHVTNAWIWNAIPQLARAELRLQPLPSGTPTTLSWSHAVQLFADVEVEKNFPGERPEIGSGELWYIGQAHDIRTKHRNAVSWSEEEDRFLAQQRYAYDIGMRRWTGSEWRGDIEDPDGDGPIEIDGSQNWHRLAYGRKVYPIADGEIIRCSWGVEENDPGDNNIEQMCSPDGDPCFWGGGGNSYRIRHADGTISSYYHLQNTDETLCPHVGAGGPVAPIAVDRNTVLGLVGNSGNSGGVHLHVELWAPLPADVDPLAVDFEADLHADGIPLIFHDVWGADPALAPEDFDPIPTPMPAVAFHGDTLVRHFGSGGAPPPTSCTEVDVLGDPVTEAMQADGDAPHVNARGLYCPDDGDLIKVCVENGDGSSDCQTCGGATAYPGCPCATDAECGGGMICWGVEGEGIPGTDPIGRCYPANVLPPAWICPYDCKAQFNGDPGAWCFNAHPSGQAKCMTGLDSEPYVIACWDEQLVPVAGGPACTDECETTADCEGLNYPAEYTCGTEWDGTPTCQMWSP